MNDLDSELSEKAQAFRDEIAGLVNAFGGTAIIGTMSKRHIGEAVTMTYLDDDMVTSFTVREVILREATREEYLSFPWPAGHDERHGHYYEIGFD